MFAIESGIWDPDRNPNCY